MTKNLPTPGSLTASGASYDGVTHAGLAVLAADTGRVLLAQRTMDETDAPEVQQTWEFPGGGLDVPEEPLAGAIREWGEETGLPLPIGAVVNGWRSTNGIYQGFVYLIETEFATDMWVPTEETQAIAWFDRAMIDAATNLRPEVKDDTDWDMIFGSVSGNEDDMPDEDENDKIGAMAAAIGAGETPTISPLRTVPPVMMVHGVLAPEDIASGDERGFSPAALTQRNAMRLPFGWQKVTAPGHNNATTIGSIDRMMRKDGLIHWEGTLLSSDEANEFIGLLSHFGQYGVSIDGLAGSLDADRSEATGMTWFNAVQIAGAIACSIPAFAEAYVALGPHPDMPADNEAPTLAAAGIEQIDMVGAREEFGRGPGWATDPKDTARLHDYWTKPGQPGYAKIGWGKGGDFHRCVVEVGEEIGEHDTAKLRFMNQICAQWHHDALGYWPATHAKMDKAGVSAAAETETPEEHVDFSEVTRLLTEGLPEESPIVATEDAESAWEAVLVSSAAGVRPPLTYFHRHPDTGATTIEDPDANGFRRVHGYAAEWGVCHIGMEGRCVEPPQTGSDDYPEFHLGRTKTDQGFIHTGLLTYGVGHRDAQTILSESATQQHFDNIKNAWAAVRVGEDERGIWFSGVVLPKVDEDDLTLIQASGQVSGEWKYGALRACLTVNTPGFPVVTATAEYDDEGNVLALAASAFGQVPDAPCSQVSGNDDDPVGDVAMAVMERIEAKQRMADLRFATLKSQWKG